MLIRSALLPSVKKCGSPLLSFVIRVFAVVVLILTTLNLIRVLRISIDSWLHRSIDSHQSHNISSECFCIDSFGNSYDLCYHLPENRTKTGQRFSCEHIEFMKELGLLSDNENDVIDPYKDGIPSPVYAMAFSSNHFTEAMRTIYLIRNLWRQQKIVIFDLGLSKKQTTRLISLCNVELRPFPFERVPKYVNELFSFRWKAIVIALMLREFGAVWYMDTSVTWKKQNLHHVYDLVQCNPRGRQQYALPDTDKRDQREALTSHESGWDKRQWRDNKMECRKSHYLLHGYTGHGIYPATSKSLYSFFPTNFHELKKEKAKMYEAGMAFAVNSKETRDIVKWYVLCSLEKDCMVPPEFTGISCNFATKNRFSSDPHCHRFDQSVINLLLANRYYYDRHYYTSEIVDFFNIVRQADYFPKDDELHCKA